MERSTSSHKPASLTAAASESGLWTGADPRIVTLRRERDEALKEIELLKAELARRDKIWALQSKMIKALVAEVPDNVRARIAAFCRAEGGA